MKREYGHNVRLGGQERSSKQIREFRLSYAREWDNCGGCR